MNKALSEFSHDEIDAANLYLRSKNIKPIDFGQLTYGKLEDADWSELHAHRSAVRKLCTASLKKLEDNAGEDECRKAEHAHDVLMGAYDQIQHEIDLRDSFGQREPLSAEQRGRPNQSGTAYADGSNGPVNIGGWRTRKGEPIRVYAPGESIAEGRASGYGVGDLVRTMIFGARNEDEKRALSEGTDSAGGYTVPTRLASEFIDKLRAKMVCFEAGARVVPLDSDNLAIARVTGDPTVAWTAENAEITASDPTFDAVTLAPKKLATLVKVSRELLEDSVNIGEALEAAFVGALSVEMDRAMLFGSGSSNQPTGLFSISGINSVSMGTNGAAVTNYDNLIDLLYEVAVDNGASPSAFIMHPRTQAAFAKLKDTANNPLNEPDMTKALRRLVTTAVPITQTQGSSSVASTVLTGDFSKMLIGVRRGLEITRLDQRYAEFDQVAFRATLRVDVAVENPVHFAKLIGVIPAA